MKDRKRKESSSFEEWLRQNPGNNQDNDLLRSFWEMDKADHSNNENLQADWKKLEISIAESDSTLKKQKTVLKINSLMIRVAAAIILLMGSTLIWYTQKDTVRLRGTSTDPIAYLLPDGSEVTLTKGSKIKYPKNFSTGERTVELIGEAYFKVTSDPKDPFYVITGEAKVRVTGTSFLVSAYRNKEEVAVLVDTGKVLFYNSETLTENAFRVGLGPGDKGIYNPKLKQLNKTHNNNSNHLIPKP